MTWLAWIYQNDIIKQNIQVLQAWVLQAWVYRGLVRVVTQKLWRFVQSKRYVCIYERMYVGTYARMCVHIYCVMLHILTRESGSLMQSKMYVYMYGHMYVGVYASMYLPCDVAYLDARILQLHAHTRRASEAETTHLCRISSSQAHQHFCHHRTLLHTYAACPVLSASSPPRPAAAPAPPCLQTPLALPNMWLCTAARCPPRVRVCAASVTPLCCVAFVLPWQGTWLHSESNAKDNYWLVRVSITIPMSVCVCIYIYIYIYIYISKSCSKEHCFSARVSW